MEKLYTICFYGGLILAAIFLIVSIVLFVMLKIPKTIRELVGHASKKMVKANKKVSKISEASKKEQAKYYNNTSGKIKMKDASSTTKNSNAKTSSNKDEKTPVSASNESKRRSITWEYMDETDVLGSSTIRVREIERTDKKNNISNKSKVSEKGDAFAFVGDISENSTAVLVKTTDEEAGNNVEVKEEIKDAKEVSNNGNSEEVTSVLMTDDDKNATEVLKPDASEGKTEVLNEEKEEKTSVLRNKKYLAEDEPETEILPAKIINKKKAHDATVLCDFMIVNTEETID